MGNWSINPNTLASIDDNGKATFQKHTEDVEYTITYNDNVTGVTTKKFMVYGCSEPPVPPVDCSLYGFVDQHYQLSSLSGGGAVAMSSASADTLTFSSSKSSNWISFDSVQGGGVINVYICLIKANNTGAERVGYAVFSSPDGCEFSGTVTQSSEVPVDEYKVVFAENNNPNVNRIMDLDFSFTGSSEKFFGTVLPSGGLRVGGENGKLYVDEGYTYNRVVTLAVNSGTARPPSDLTVTVDNTSKIITVKYTYTGNI